MKKNVLRILLYGSVGLIAFVVFLYIQLPTSFARQVLKSQMEKELGYKYQVQISELDFSIFSGVQMEGVQIKPLVISVHEKRKPIPLLIDELEVDASLIDTIKGKPEISFNAVLANGTISGVYRDNDEGKDLEILCSEVNLTRFPIFKMLTGVSLGGILTGEIKLDLSDDKRPVSGGGINLLVSNAVLGPDMIETDKIPPFTVFEVPKTDIGNLKIKIGFRASSVNFESFEGEGKDMSLELSGRIIMAKQFSNSTLRLVMRFKPEAEYIDKNNLRPIVDSKEFKRGLSGGWYSMVLSGTVKSPHPAFTKRAGTSGKSHGNPQSGPRNNRKKPKNPKPAKIK